MLSFSFNLNRFPSEIITGYKKPTKRQFLSLLMSIYDPLGLLGPLVIHGRIIFQNVMRSKIGWDDEIRSLEYESWLIWFSRLKTATSLRIPRWYQFSLYIIDSELHTFCDAGENAYGVVCYLRYVYTNGHVRLTLLGSKARVAPLKTVSIPRMELQAALLGSRFGKYIFNQLRKLPTSIKFWTDSCTVLAWIRSDHRNYKPFVAHRVAEIIENTPIEDWRWLPSNYNVADLLTKINVCSFDTDSFWMRGPEFAYESQQFWPVEPANTTAPLPEEKKVTVAAQIEYSIPIPVVPDINRFSKWMRYVRTTALVYKFCKALLGKIRFKNTTIDRAETSNSLPVLPLEASDIIFAEILIFKKVQINSFAAEIACLKSGRPLVRSRIAILNPVLDDNQLLRLSGRIGNVLDVCESIKHPIILPKNDSIVHLLVQHYHERFAHGNTETIINEFRQVYWVPGLRNLVRSVAHRCQRCRLSRAVPTIPPEGNLPSERLAHHNRPFSFCGLDYFGPVNVTVGRHREKRWVALFTCLTTRAVHLEVVRNLTSDSAIMALRRLIARRGCPVSIISDNSTSFHGAKNELRRARTEIDPETRNFATLQGITWKFIPPAAPFMGGAWERLVRVIKKTLAITLHEQAPKEETLETLLQEAESIANCRPLTHISTEPGTEEALTPFHFILGTSSTAPQFGIFNESDTYNRKEWRKSQILADKYWKRWIKEYLPILIPPHYHSTTKNEFKLGDVVLIADNNLPRNTWPIGRISRLCPGKDNVVRMVEVQTQGGKFTRPVRKVVLLPTTPDISTTSSGKGAPNCSRVSSAMVS